MSYSKIRTLNLIPKFCFIIIAYRLKTMIITQLYNAMNNGQKEGLAT